MEISTEHIRLFSVSPRRVMMKLALAVSLFLGVALASKHLGTCPLGPDWVVADGLCFKRVTDLMSYRQADKYCEEYSTDACQSGLLDPANVDRVSAVYEHSATDHLWYRVRAFGVKGFLVSSIRPLQRIVCPPEDHETWCTV